MCYWDWRDVTAVKRKYCPCKGSNLVTYFVADSGLQPQGSQHPTLASLDTCYYVQPQRDTYIFQTLKNIFIKTKFGPSLYLDDMVLLILWPIECTIVKVILEANTLLSSDSRSAGVSLDRLLPPFCSAPSSRPSLADLYVCLYYPDSRQHRDSPG